MDYRPSGPEFFNNVGETRSKTIFEYVGDKEYTATIKKVEFTNSSQTLFTNLRFSGDTVYVTSQKYGSGYSESIRVTCTLKYSNVGKESSCTFGCYPPQQ